MTLCAPSTCCNLPSHELDAPSVQPTPTLRDWVPVMLPPRVAKPFMNHCRGWIPSPAGRQILRSPSVNLSFSVRVEILPFYSRLFHGHNVAKCLHACTILEETYCQHGYYGFAPACCFAYSRHGFVFTVDLEHNRFFTSTNSSLEELKQQVKADVSGQHPASRPLLQHDRELNTTLYFV